MDDLRRRRTARLELAEVTAGDLDDLYALSRDPRAWTHLPTGVHTRPEQTAEQLAGFTAGWARDGLGYWTVRTHDGEFIGVGGCMLLRGGWNVYYRLRPEAQGHGYAAETVLEAMAAARHRDPDLPIFASLLEHNVASKAVAERVGLVPVFRGVDPSDPSGASVRLVYADRHLDPEAARRLADRA